MSDACPGLVLLACHAKLPGGLIHSGVLPAPVVAVRVRRYSTFDREVPSFHLALCHCLWPSRGSFSTDDPVSATVPLFRGAGDTEPSVRGRSTPSDARSHDSRGNHGGSLEARGSRLQVSAVWLYSTEIDVSTGLPRLCCSPWPKSGRPGCWCWQA
jgi:hypothetical protein